MKSKKGFTLVELLAVIAILAILVIIALPNVLNMYTTAKKNTFVTEVQNLAKSVGSKYIQESMAGNSIRKISNSTNSLDTNGKHLEYTFELDSKGNITNTIVSDGTYCVSTTKKYTDLSISDVKENCTYNNLNNIAGTIMKDFYQKSGRTSNDLVSSIEFYSDGRTFNIAEKYDVSEAQDNSIIMYVEPEKTSSSLIKLIIVADGKISLPSDCSYFFSFYKMYSSSTVSNLKNLKFNNSIDTSNVTNMSYMFYYSPIVDLDLSGFNTSNVTNMKSMFYRSSASNFDITNFDFSNVTDVSYMFFGTSNAGTLSFKNFSAPKLVNASHFLELTSYDQIEINNLNAPNLIDMSYMFNNTRTTKIMFTNVNTSNVEKMNYMFGLTYNLTEIDLSNFNFNSSANMDNMFLNTKATVGYVSDSTIASKLNALSSKPSTLTFVVK